MRGEELDDLALQAADDALVAVLAKLDDYRGASRFTTWAYKFALLEAGVRLRRRAWQEREVVLEPETWPLMADAGQSPQSQAETRELMRALKQSIDGCLTEHQREVLVALALNGVPLDVLAERSTRPVARSTRRCTTHAESCAPTSPRRALRSTRSSGDRQWTSGQTTTP